MNLFQSILLGIIQGLTEFLPVSSSGHLTLFQHLFGLSEPVLMFDILLHVATLIPVLFVYRNEIIKLIKNPFQKTTLLLIIATIPAVVAALLLGDMVDAMFASVLLLGFSFVATGIVLLIADKISNGHKRDKDMTPIDALLIGCAQAIAIIPGLSRSGSTITASLARKLDRESAARFSFLMSIPAILGALVLQLFKVFTGSATIEGVNWLNTGAGFVAAMLSGYLAINFMLTLIQKAKLRYFSYYVFALAAFIWIDQLLLGGMFIK